jgi:hypothetical protein
MPNSELSDLAIFAAVADARSFTRAAAELGKSQSALSQSVHRLVALAARYAVPACYEFREFAVYGGLMSCGASITEGVRRPAVTPAKLSRAPSPLTCRPCSRLNLSW